MFPGEPCPICHISLVRVQGDPYTMNEVDMAKFNEWMDINKANGKDCNNTGCQCPDCYRNRDISQDHIDDLKAMNGNVKLLMAKARAHDHLISAAKAAYQKHHMGDDSIGWDELGTMLWDAICFELGEEAAYMWRRSIDAKDEVICKECGSGTLDQSGNCSLCGYA